MPVQAVLVATDMLPDIWPEVRGLIEGACQRSSGKYLPADVLKLLISQNMQLWIAVDGEILAAAITEIAVYPQRKVCRILVTTGEDATKWAHLIGEIEKWAKQWGCSAIEPITRPGWERWLKPMGYERQHVILEKPL